MFHEAVRRIAEHIQDGLEACEAECVRRTLEPFGGAMDGVHVERATTGVQSRVIFIIRHGQVVGRWSVCLTSRGDSLVTMALPA